MMADDQRQWPYTTPSGHTYVEPTTYRDLRERGNDYAQAIIETWDPPEHPPSMVTWKMLGIALDEADNRRRASVLLAHLVGHWAECPAPPDAGCWDCYRFEMLRRYLSDDGRPHPPLNDLYSDTGTVPAVVSPFCGQCAVCLERVREVSEAAEGFSMAALMITNGRMILCPDCGNKRCPKATDHRLKCTGSNEPDQPGSRYGTPVRLLRDYPLLAKFVVVDVLATAVAWVVYGLLLGFWWGVAAAVLSAGYWAHDTLTRSIAWRDRTGVWTGVP